MAFVWLDVPQGFGADATLKITNETLVKQLPFPPVNGGNLKWGAAEATVSADGNVSLRIAVYKHAVGYTVTKVKVTNGVRVAIPLSDLDYKIVVTRVNETGSSGTVPVTVQVESLLKA